MRALCWEIRLGSLELLILRPPGDLGCPTRASLPSLANPVLPKDTGSGRDRDPGYPAGCCSSSRKEKNSLDREDEKGPSWWQLHIPAWSIPCSASPRVPSPRWPRPCWLSWLSSSAIPNSPGSFGNEKPVSAHCLRWVVPRSSR